MAKKSNEGKKFEEDFRKSIPDNIWFYRFRDGTSSWDGGEMTRFQKDNICDCEIYKFPHLCLFELKSTQQKNLPLYMIKTNQIIELYQASLHNGIIAGIIVNFRTLEKTYFISIYDVVDYFMKRVTNGWDRFKEELTGKRDMKERVEELFQESTSKSIPVKHVSAIGIIIQQFKLRIRYRYDIDSFIG